MSGDRASAIAAAVIIACVATGFVLLPTAMLWLGDISPWLALGFAGLFVLAFFAIFWLRGRFQRARQTGSDD